MTFLDATDSPLKTSLRPFPCPPRARWFGVAGLALLSLAAAAQDPAAVDRYRAGYTLLQSKDYRNAAIELESAVAQDSSYGDAHYGLGMAQYSLGEYGKSAASLEAAMRHGLTQERLAARVPGLLADLHYKAGLDARQQQRFGEAIQHFEASLGYRPGNAQAHYTIALCQLSLRQPDKAMPALQAAVAADSTYPWPYKSLGDIHRQRNELALAAQMYERAIAVDASVVQAYTGLAQVRIASEDLEGAVVTLQQAVAVDAGYVEGAVLLGTALNQLQRFDEAVATLERATELDRSDADGWYRLGEAYLGTGQFRSAAEAAGRAVRLRRDFYAAMIVLADAHEHLGELEEARAWYQRASSDSRSRDYVAHKLRELERAQATAEGR